MKFLSLAALCFLFSSANPIFAAPVTSGTLDFNNTTAAPQSYNAFSTDYNGTGTGSSQALPGMFFIRIPAIRIAPSLPGRP